MDLPEGLRKSYQEGGNCPWQATGTEDGKKSLLSCGLGWCYLSHAGESRRALGAGPEKPRSLQGASERRGRRFVALPRASWARSLRVAWCL